VAVTAAMDMHTIQLCRLSGRLREQARSHSWIVGRQVDECRLAGRHRRQASSHNLIVGLQVDGRRQAGRLPHLKCIPLWELACLR